MKKIFGYLSFFFLLLFVDHCIPCAMAQTPYITGNDKLKEILKNFESRKSRLSSLNLVITIRELMRKGALSEAVAIDRTLFPGQVNPPEDIILNTNQSFTWKGDSMRLDNNQEIWSSAQKKPIKLDEIQVFHENQFKLFSKHLKRGSISKRNTISSKVEAQVLTAYLDLNITSIKGRPLDILGYENGYVIIGNTDYNGPNFKGATRHEFLLDPHRGYIPVRYRNLYPDGRMSFEAHINYAPQPDIDYIPTSATLNLFTKDKIEATRDIKVKSFKVNFAVDPKIFELEFPAGTDVFDKTSMVTTIVGQGPVLGEEMKGIVKKIDVGPRKETALAKNTAVSTSLPSARNLKMTTATAKNTQAIEARREEKNTAVYWLLGIAVLGGITISYYGHARKRK